MSFECGCKNDHPKSKFLKSPKDVNRTPKKTSAGPDPTLTRDYNANVTKSFRRNEIKLNALAISILTTVLDPCEFSLRLITILCI